MLTKIPAAILNWQNKHKIYIGIQGSIAKTAIKKISKFRKLTLNDLKTYYKAI